MGPGRVLADLIRSEAVEVVRLTEIFRQAERSLIVVNAHRVNQGRCPIRESVDSDGDFFFIEREEPEEIAARPSPSSSPERIPAKFGLDPVRADPGAHADEPRPARHREPQRRAARPAQPRGRDGRPAAARACGWATR